MVFQEISIGDKDRYNALVSHPLQSWEWGEFREKTNVKVVRRGKFDGKKLIAGFQLTIHQLPFVSYTIGYLPKGTLPDEEMLNELMMVGKENKCIFIKLEPNVEANKGWTLDKVRPLPNFDLRGSSHPLFTKYTFQLDLTKSEEELLKQMNSKTRYNLRLAQKKGVIVEENNTEAAFKEYLRLTFETTKRQKFFAHDEKYHRLMWETLRLRSGQAPAITHLLTAKYQGKTLVAWIVFLFNHVLYYPYGASSSEHREVMASNLMMWEAIRWGKIHGAKVFDLWGALGPNPDFHDPWHGFHRFKEGYGPRHVEFVGSYDLILNPFLYQLYTVANTLRWFVLNIMSGCR